MVAMIRAALPLLLVATPAIAELTPATLAAAKATPATGTRLPGELVFRDVRDGHARRLRDVIAGRATALAVADFTCRHLCGPGRSLTEAALARAGLPRNGYRLVVIGLDPNDAPAAGRAVLARLAAQPGVAANAAVLSGDAATVGAATRRLGYGYAYDPASDQFAHDASLYVFDRGGALVSVLPELAVTPAMLRAALAGQPAPEGLFARVAHLCYGFAAAHGRYGAAVVRTLQLMSAALLVAGGAWLLRRRRAG